MKNLILLYVVACLLLVGCEARKMSVEEIVQTVNSYKRQSTQESLSLAETFLNKGIVDNPGNVVLLKELIAINGVQKKWDKADEYALEGIRVAPEDFVFHLSRCRILLNKGRLKECIAICDITLPKTKDLLLSANVLHIKGNAELRMGDKVAAKKDLLKALELYKVANSDNFVINNDIGSMYFNEKKIDLAKQFIEKSLLQNPDNFVAINNMGKIFHAKGDYEMALDFFNKSLFLEPNQPDLEEAVKSLKKEIAGSKGK